VCLPHWLGNRCCCTYGGIASGLVGAVVVLMGVIAHPS